jgi:MscS family membrane protein
MLATRFGKPLVLVFSVLIVSALTACAQAPAPAAKTPIRVRRPQECLVSPRETLRTLYYAIVAYDKAPQLIDEAILCLDLDLVRARDAVESSRLAIDLELILRTLCVSTYGVPETAYGNVVPILDENGLKVSLTRGTDGLWRFSRETVNQIPAMSRTCLARFRDMQSERAALESGLTDPSATMRRFLVDTMNRDFYSAAWCLDLSKIPQEERSEQGPLLARKLAFIVQRRGWVFLQEVPNHPNGPAFTWHADKTGRIVVERVCRENGKEAWLFSTKTVRNIAAMYEQAKAQTVDWRFMRLGVAMISADDTAPSRRAPANVPAKLGSPRALLKGFFRVMDAAETQDAKLVEALDFLDLRDLPEADMVVQGTKLACKLEALLRKINVELSALPDDWNAPTQVLGESQGARVEIVRQRDGCWRFSQATVSQAPAFLDKLTSKEKPEHERASRLESARDTMSTFLSFMRRGDYEGAAECLDLSSFRPGAQTEIGPVLAYKLKYVIDRIGRVYIQEVPDRADGPRYVFYRGELGRIVIARKASGPRAGNWLVTRDTVRTIEHMFNSVVNQPVNEASAETALARPTFVRAPGLWVRFRVPPALRDVWWKLETYQWVGIFAAMMTSVLGAWLILAEAYRLFSFILRKSGSVLSKPFVSAKLRPLTWVAAWWLLFEALALLDLPIHLVDALVPIKSFGMAGLIAWFGMQFVDLVTSVYTNSEYLRPHRSLSDMVVPASMRSLKGVILLLVTVYIVYQIGAGESLSRFLTGLGVAGLAASLAAQDTLKSFLSTLLLIGERSFKIGDKIAVAGVEGVVEQVGFRATRLRTSDGSLLTIPNSTIASAPIDNLTTKSFTRCKASLLVKYDTAPEHIIALRDSIRAWLVEHPKVRSDKVQVNVNRLTEQGVEVTLDLYLVDVNGEGEKEVMEEINCELLRSINRVTTGEGSLYHTPPNGGKTPEAAFKWPSAA